MLTVRGRWTLALAVMATTAGIMLRQEGAALAGLALAVWIGIEWIVFSFRTLTANQIFTEMNRRIGNDLQEHHTLSIDQPFDVQFEAEGSPRLQGLRVRIEDVVPPGLEVVEGSPGLIVDIESGSTVRISYRLKPQVTGKSNLPGLKVLLGDAQGLFHRPKFVPLLNTLTTLPFLIRPSSTMTNVKQNNVQLLAGNHRYRRPGFSTELLGIREYQTGDPPRSIAWKATARTGKLMTCEYENEVPIRATIIADLSPYQFAARPKLSVADNIICSATSIARLLIADRDPVACVLASDTGRTRMSHAGGQRQLTRLIQTMLSFSARQTDVEQLSIEQLVETAWWNCFRLFPERFDERINPRSPGWLTKLRDRKRVGMRQQLAYVFAELYDKPLGFAIRMRADNGLLRESCIRFFDENPSCDFPHVDVTDFLKVRSMRLQTNERICKALIEGVARAHDNELFIVIANFVGGTADLDRLEDAVRIVRASYHRAILIDISHQDDEKSFVDPLVQRILRAELDREDLAIENQFVRRFEKLGAKTAKMDDPQLIEKVAAEVELLKFGRVRGSANLGRLARAF